MGIQLQRGRFAITGKLVGASLAILALVLQPVITGNLPSAFAVGATNTYVSTSGSGTVCSHAAPCATFAAAIAAVGDGGTVHAANGVYTENVTVNKPITVKGDGGRNNVTLNGSIKIDHDNVTVRGFTVTNPTGTYGVLVNDVDNVSVVANAFDHVGSSYTAGAVQAVYVLKTSTGVLVDSNTFTAIGNAAGVQSNKAIFVGDSNNGPSANVTITRNTIDGVSSAKGAYGLLINHEVTGASVTRNVVRNLNGLWATAIGLEANTPNAVVQSNNVKTLTSTLGSTAFHFESNPSAPTAVMTGDSFDGRSATNSTSVVAVDASWAALDPAVAGHTYPEVYFHGKYYYYGLNAFATIEDALAHVSAGGTVYVEAGTYSDVRATGSYAANISVKGYSHPVINGLDLTGATFDGLLFQGFSFTGDSNGYGNFSVTVSDNGSYKNLSFVSNIFDGQSAPARGAIFLNRGFDGFSLQKNAFKNYNGSAAGTVYSVVFAEAQTNTVGANFVATKNTLRTSNAVNFIEAYRWNGVSLTANNVSAQTGRLLVWSDDSAALGTVDISDNTVKVQQGTGLGVYYAPGTTLTLTGNTVTGAGSCVKIDSVSDSTVTGNTFKNCSTNGVKFSQNGATTPVNAVISDNSFVSGPVGAENNVAGFAPVACNNSFTTITTQLYSNPGPFNTVTCAAPTLVSPVDGAVVKGASVTNSWNTVSGALKYQYQSYDHSNLTGLRWDHEYTATSKTATNVADGTVFYWRVRAIDALGNKSPWSDLWKVVVDDTAPVISIDAPADGAVLQGPVEVRGSVTDANPHHYWLQIKKDNVVIYDQTTNESSSFTDRLLRTLTDEGSYQVRFAARDAAGGTASSGNRSGDVVVNFTIDSTAPEVTIDDATVTIDTITPIITATDNDPNLTYSWVANDADSAANVSISDPSVKEPTFTVNADGDYSFTLTVTDTAGNATSVDFEFSYSASTNNAGGSSSSNSQGSQRSNANSAAARRAVANNTNGFTGVTTNGGQSVLGAEDNQTTNDDGGDVVSKEVKGTQDEKSVDSASTASGLAWYWWLIIAAAVLGFIWWLIAALRRRSAQE